MKKKKKVCSRGIHKLKSQGWREQSWHGESTRVVGTIRPNRHRHGRSGCCFVFQLEHALTERVRPETRTYKENSPRGNSSNSSRWWIQWWIHRCAQLLVVGWARKRRLVRSAFDLAMDSVMDSVMGSAMGSVMVSVEDSEGGSMEDSAKVSVKDSVKGPVKRFSSWGRWWVQWRSPWWVQRNIGWRIEWRAGCRIQWWFIFQLLSYVFLLFAFCHLLFAICHLLFAICHLPFAICQLPVATCYLLPAFCDLRFAICDLEN